MEAPAESGTKMSKTDISKDSAETESKRSSHVIPGSLSMECIRLTNAPWLISTPLGVRLNRKYKLCKPNYRN